MNFLFDKKNPQYPDRFNLYVLDEFIEGKLFKNLRDTFPSDDYISIKTKFAFSLQQNEANFSAFLNSNKLWREFINRLDSNDFKNEVIKNFDVKNVYFSDNSLKRFIPFYKKVNFEFTFNKSKNGAYSDAHTDSTRKIVSMIIFFTPETWTEENGGLVCLFKPKNENDENNWRNEIIDENRLKIIQTIDPKPNRFYGFKKTKNSYHSVTKVKCENSMSRNVLMINLSYSKKEDIPYDNLSVISKIFKKLRKILKI